MAAHPPAPKLFREPARTAPVQCPACGGPITLRGFGAIEQVSCPYCGSELRPQDSGALQILRQAQRARQASALPLYTRGTLDGIEWELIGIVWRQCVVDGIAYFKADALGTLTLADCINDAGDANCANPPGTPLDGANAVALSPDGKSLYVASANADSVSHLSIGANGSPTFADCVADQASVGCTPDPGFMLDGAEDVAVSPDGANVYVASALADSLTRLNTGADGSLQYGGCLADTASGGCGDLANSPLNGADGVVVADEGGLGNVYATAGVADAVSRFSRELPVVTPLDTTPPETKIDKGPKRTSTRRKAKFVFSSSEPGSTFVCAVDGAEPKTCTSPHKVKVKVGKRPRRHRFSVAATDASGNTDATPSVLRWKVKPKMHGKHGKPGRQK